MPLLLLFVLATLASCSPRSSPEGRLTTRFNAMQRDIDSLKEQNQMILNSLYLRGAAVR
jgi:hypothetical protein